MNKVELEFKQYTNNYLSYGEMIALKISHTKRVAEICLEIARGLNLSSEDIELAYICGYLHDIGRFEQWKRYQKFNDSQSIDHGDLGYSILRENDFINKFIENTLDKEVILSSVKYHNKYKIPDDLTDREKLFTNIVRDADKIDILYEYTIGKIKINLDDSKMTDKVFENFKNHTIISLKDRKTKADALAISLAFPFDINFSDSLKILRDKNYLNIEIDMYLKEAISEELKEQLELIRGEINNYFKERID